MLHSGIPYICRTVKFYDVQDKMVQWNKSGEGESGYFLDCAENVVALDAAVDLIMNAPGAVVKSAVLLQLLLIPLRRMSLLYYFR